VTKQVAVVTGGTGGIGTSICQRLAATNYHVMACYYKKGNHNEAKQWQQKQQEKGFDIDIIYANIAHFEDCENLIQLVVERYGCIDVLVNNAGITCDVSLKKMAAHQWQQVIDSNLNSIFNMTRNVLPVMLDKKFGRIISISSINGRKGQFGQCNYSASKAALYGFTKSLAQEVATKGITVNTISPGYVETPMLETMQEDILKSIVQNIPVGRLGKPQEIADAVAFLANPSAGFITGANLDINGGQYM
jgi:acetoacetyl-CoA reductase